MTLIDRERLTCIGVVQQAHGIRGEIKVIPQTEAPEYYRRMKRVYLFRKGELTGHDVRQVHLAGGLWRLALEGLETRNDAEAKKGAEVLMDESELRPLAEDEYFRHDLVGCTVKTMDGDPVGTVAGIMETGANDVLEVTGTNGPVLIPLVREIVKAVDTASKTIRIDPVPGLLEPDEER